LVFENVVLHYMTKQWWCSWWYYDYLNGWNEEPQLAYYLKTLQSFDLLKSTFILVHLDFDFE